jgi:Ni,Fe-hydrogenase III small subunit
MDLRLGPGTDVMILKIFSPKTSVKKLAFLTPNKAKLCKILIVTLIFEKKNRRKLSKIAENCDHNIDPWTAILPK